MPTSPSWSTAKPSSSVTSSPANSRPSGWISARRSTSASPLVACTTDISTTSLPRWTRRPSRAARSEEHTSELQSRGHLVCRLLLEKKNHHDTESDDDGRKDNNQDRLTQASRADTSVQRRGLYHSPYDESALSDEHQ